MRKQIHDNPIDHGCSCALSRGTWRRVGAKLACAGACALMAGQLLLPNVALAADWVNVAARSTTRAPLPATRQEPGPGMALTT